MRIRPPSPDEVLSVSALTASIRSVLEDSFGSLWVAGEISNFRRQASGHAYFTLKDQGAQIAAVLFRSAYERVPFRPGDGQSVIALGDLTVYDQQGKYQIVVRHLIPAGQGDLRARFDALKAKLHEEGLFDPARKRPLPAFPQSVVLVTSPTGAALQDILNILRRRAPQLDVRLFPVRVQGAEAGPEIVAALDHLTGWFRAGLFRPDALILARGGGSLEDLWPFNEESVARALARCPIPSLVGVGHEIDFTIADFVADRRAPTPSAAAELLIPDRAELLETIRRHTARLDRCVTTHFNAIRAEFRRLASSVVFREPSRIVELFWQRLDDLTFRLDRAPQALLDTRRKQLELRAARLDQRSPVHRLRLIAARLDGLNARLALLHPQRTLARGFAIVRTESGDIARSVADIPAGGSFTAELADGHLAARRSG